MSTAAVKNKHTYCASSPVRRPPVFGASIRNYGTDKNNDKNTNNNTNLSGIDLEDRENCPLCEKYSQGPCGKLFQTWLQCTDNHPGKDPNNTQQDLHLSKCASYAKALAACLDKNETYYNAPFSEQQFLEDDNDELQQAWERLIQEDLTQVPRKEFPQSHQPQLEFRPKDRLGVIFVDLQDIHRQSLLLVFVQDADSQILLSAGSLDDLFVFSRDGKDTGVLQCTLPKQTKSIVVSSMYEGEGETQVQKSLIYTYTAKVPEV